MNKSRLKGDISAIECNAEDCDIIIDHTDEPYAQAEYSGKVKFYVEKDSSRLKIEQKRRFISKIFGGKSCIKLYIPGHIVPHLSFSGGSADCEIRGGIYGDINFSAARGSIILGNAAAESLTVNSENCNVNLSACTIRGNIATTAESGDASLEHTFATHICCRTKKGNIGAVELNCRDTIFEVGEGNVTATVLGDETTFDVIVNAKDGTCNKESLNIENNDASFKAYVLKGNIFIDFIDGKEL